MFRVSAIALMLGFSVMQLSALEEQQNAEAIKENYGEKIVTMVRSFLKQVHDHPYLSALVLWCGVYHKTAYKTLETYGSNPLFFIPLVGTVIFYLLHDQHDFFSGKFGDNEHLELSINLGNNSKKEKPAKQE